MQTARRSGTSRTVGRFVIIHERGMVLFCVVHNFGFAQNVNLDLAGIGELVLDLFGNVAGQKHHLVFGDGLGLDHNADFAAGLDGIGTCNAREALGNFFQFLQALDVVLNVLAAGTGP